MHALIADDDGISAAHLAGLLRGRGLAVTVVADGAEARRVLGAGARNIDLALLNWMLPGADGWRLAEELAGASRPPVTVLMARRAFVGELRRRRPAGAEDFLGKPLRDAEVAAVLARAAERLPLPGGPPQPACA